MDIDDVYKEIGEFGSYQKKIFWSFGFVQALLALHQVQNVFVGATPRFYCKRGTGADEVAIQGCPADDKPCDKYSFPGDDFTSIASEWKLVCDQAYKADLAQSCVMFGILLGSLVFGYLGDKYGRRKIVYTCALAVGVITMLGIFSPSLEVYLVTRVLSGTCLGGLGMIGFVLVTEVIGSSKRGFAGMVMPFCFALGLAFYSLMAYFIREWRILSALTAVPMLFGLYLYWLLPESPRWLYSQGMVDEAERLLEIFACKNNGHLPNKTILLKRDDDDYNRPAPPQPGLLEVFRNPILRSLTLNNSFTWFVNCAVYYGLTLSAGNLGGNLYMSVALSALVEVPAYVMAFFLMERVGRRYTYSLSMLAGGLCCLVIILVPSYYSKSRMGLAVAGKMGISMSFCVAWLYAAEMYPTNIRNKAISVCNMMARLGGIICPMIVAYGKTHPNMDFVILGVMTLLAGVVCLKLPETLGKHMPETIDDLMLVSKHHTKVKVATDINTPSISEEKLKLLQSEIENNEEPV